MKKFIFAIIAMVISFSVHADRISYECVEGYKFAITATQTMQILGGQGNGIPCTKPKPVVQKELTQEEKIAKALAAEIAGGVYASLLTVGFMLGLVLILQIAQNIRLYQMRKGGKQ